MSEDERKAEEKELEDGRLPDWADHGFPGGFLGVVILVAVAFCAGYLAYWLAGALMYR